MTKYPTYKDSGIEWLGQIPTHWDLLRNKIFITEHDNVVGQDAYKYTLLSLTKQGVIQRDIESGKGKFPKEFDNYKIVESGNIIFCLFDVDETPRTVGLSSIDGMITGAYNVFSIKGINSQFYYYYFLAVDEAKALRPLYSGLRKVVKTERFAGLRIPVPPEEEQRQIVAYLDYKSNKINERICQRERELQTLSELKQAEIATVVTRGLDPNVPMKESGIEWLGKIPAHWGMMRAKYMFNKEKRAVRTNDKVVTCFRDGQVTLRENRRISGFTESLTETGYQGVRKGDLVIHQMDAFAGAIGVSDADGKGTSVYHCCTPKGNYSPHYYAHLIREMARSGYIESLYRGIRERSSDFNYDTFSKQYLPIPPREEQDAIVSYLQSRITFIDNYIAKLKEEINYLQEYKQRLISDVVTGKVDVRGVEIPSEE